MRAASEDRDRMKTSRARRSTAVCARNGVVPSQLSRGVRSQNTDMAASRKSRSGSAWPPRIMPTAAPVAKGTSSMPQAPCARGTTSARRRDLGTVTDWEASVGMREKYVAAAIDTRTSNVFQETGFPTVHETQGPSTLALSRKLDTPSLGMTD